MDGLSAIQQLNDLQAQLDATISLMSKQGKELSEAERDYYIALRQQAVLMKDAGEPATLINLTIKGVPEVANLRYERDFAQSRYDTSREKIMALKLNIHVLREIISREWGREQ